MEKNTSLHKIGKFYGTDKSSLTHSFNNRSFLDFYEFNFHNLKSEKINLLEIGILNGNSLRTWRDYFQNGNIVGLDVDPSTQFVEDRIKTYLGSQDNEDICNKIINDYGQFDIILDDGSHINDLTIKSFELFFKHLKPGGYYVIEDTHCTYENALRTWPGMSYNQNNLNYENERHVFNGFIEKLLNELDHKRGEILNINFYSETIIIKKID